MMASLRVRALCVGLTLCVALLNIFAIFVCGTAQYLRFASLRVWHYLLSSMASLGVRVPCVGFTLCVVLLNIFAIFDSLPVWLPWLHSMFVLRVWASLRVWHCSISSLPCVGFTPCVALLNNYYLRFTCFLRTNAGTKAWCTRGLGRLDCGAASGAIGYEGTCPGSREQAAVGNCDGGPNYLI